MSCLRPGKFIQVISGRWYETKKVELSECCQCSLTHKIYSKIRDGEIYQKFTVLDKVKK